MINHLLLKFKKNGINYKCKINIDINKMKRTTPYFEELQCIHRDTTSRSKGKKKKIGCAPSTLSTCRTITNVARGTSRRKRNGTRVHEAADIR